MATSTRPQIHFPATKTLDPSKLCHGGFKWSRSATLYRAGHELFHAEGWLHTWSDTAPPHERNHRLATSLIDRALPGDVVRVVEYFEQRPRMSAMDWRVVSVEDDAETSARVLAVRPLPKSRQGRLNPT